VRLTGRFRRLDLRDERGITLIEMLVATACAMIVGAATLAIVITSVHLSSNYNDRVDADQQGRISLERMTQALNSSCVAAGVAPIMATSDDTHAWFYSSLSDSAVLHPNEVEIALTASNSLVMYTYAWVSGTAPTGSSPWVFSGTPTPTSGFTLIQNVSQDVISGTTQPIFKYYGYSTTPAGQLSSTPYSTSPNLGATNAAKTAMVAINFVALPGDNWNATGRGSDVNDQIVLRLTPASSAAGATDPPCS
jgi:Tfp pilus assembly protein PilW